MNTKENKMVAFVDESTMDGDTTLEKQINAYLTKQFILSKDVPSDECLTEARAVIKMVLDSISPV